MKRFTAYTFSIFMLIAFNSCNKTPEIDNSTMLDGDQIFDASLYHPENYLASAYIVNASPQQLNTPVIIVAHGYSASTFEWDELRTLANLDSTFYVSQVLLGGHGRTYEAFLNASWKDWQSSIIDEYTKLSNLGFKNIYLAGSSTGAPLIINLVKTGFFNSLTKPKGIFLIDPIIVSSNKTLTMVGLLGPILGYTTVELDTGEMGHWYVYRPQETLKQLMSLINICRKDLEDGITLPTGTFMKVFKSTKDEVADAVSALLIYKGVKMANGNKIEVEMVDSKLHVYTRLKGRSTVSANDYSLQAQTFAEIRSKMLQQ